jgi:hypothetical protein
MPSFTLCLCPPLGDQLGDKVAVFRYMARHNCLRRFDGLLRSTQAQFTFTDGFDQQLIARLQTGCGAAFRWDYDATLLVDPSPRLHDTSPHICHNTVYMAF